MLNNIELFIKLVNVGGFNQLAKLLGINQSTVSRRIQDLEAYLQLKLINHDHRIFRLTDFGYSFYEQFKESTNELGIAWQNTLNSLCDENPHGTLRLLITTESVNSLIPELLPNFLKLYPNAKIYLSFTKQGVNLQKQTYDMAIASVLPETSNHSVKLLNKFYFKLYASPKYIAKYGRINSLSELTNHRCVGTLSLTGEEQNTYVIHEIENRKNQIIQHISNLYTDTVTQAIAIARSGEYMIGAWDIILRNELLSGELEAVLAEYIFMEQPCYLIRKPGINSKLEQKFAEFIETIFK